MDKDKFYTGFTWEEIKEIAAALKRSYRSTPTSAADDDAFFDYPSYAGLPNRISNRLLTDQVDYLNDSQPRSVNQVARILAKGYLESAI